MYRSNLAGTVSAYERHVFLCYRSPEVWPTRVEDSDADLLPKLLSSAIKAHKNEISFRVSNALLIIEFETVAYLIHEKALLFIVYRI